MAAEDHLSVGQFGYMTPHELTRYWDPNLRTPQTLREWSGHRYIENLAANIKEHGMQRPVQIMHHQRLGRTIIYDGHHRVLAALDLGLEEVPYRVVSGRPGEQ